MKRFLVVASLGATLFVIPPASSQSPFDGTWKADLSHAEFSTKPEVYLIQDGVYSCKTCDPPYSIKADGTDQPVSGYTAYNTVAITILNDHSVREVDKKDGKVFADITFTVLPDGKSAENQGTAYVPNNPPIVMKSKYVLVEKGPPGSHKSSGSWRLSAVDIPDQYLMITYKTTGDELTMTSNGQSYTAKNNGPETDLIDPNADRSVKRTVSIKLSGNTLEETFRRNGDVERVVTTTLDPDGKIGTVVEHNAKHDEMSRIKLIKQ